MQKSYSQDIQRLTILILVLMLFGLKSMANQRGVSAPDTARIVSLNKKFDAALEAKDYAAAKAYADTILSVSRSLNDNTLIGDAYFSFGQVEKAMQNRNVFIEQLKTASVYYKRDNAYRLTGKCYFLIGQTFVELNDLNSALEYFYESYAMRAKTDDSLSLANVAVNIASIEYKTGDYPAASDYFFRALKLAEGLKNDKIKAMCLSNLSHLSNKMNNYGQSLAYLEQALEIQRRLGNRLSESNVLSNFGNTYVEMKEYAKAKEYYEDAIKIKKEINDEKGIAMALGNLGIIARLENDTAKAKEYYNRARIIGNRLGDKEVEAFLMSNLALLSSMGNHQESEKLLLNSLQKSKELGNPILIMANYKNLKEYYEKIGNDKKALEYATLYQSLNDSTFRTENSNKILELQTKYETAEKEKQVAVLTSEKLEKDIKLQNARQIRLLLIGGMAFLIILAALIYSRYLIKKRSQAQLALMNNQLKELNSTKDKLFSIVSHDLKNSVSAFTNITQVLNNSFEKMNQKDIKYYLDELSGSAGSMKQLFGNLLNWAKSQQNMIKVEPVNIRVLNLIEDSLEPVWPKINSKKIAVRIECNEHLELMNDFDILNTVLRNLITNAVKFSPAEGEVVVSAWKNESDMHIKVADKGIGMEPEQIELLKNPYNHILSKPDTEGEKGAGLGLSLCRELLTKISGTMHIMSVKNEGSQFEIIVPLSVQSN